ncbi:MAG: L-threonylcarbamoyladenylate synthase [Nitrososphaerota archaeon]
MNTQILRVNPNDPEVGLIKIAAEVIKRGGLVAFPTETVYGLGADAFNPEAVRKIYVAKGRPLDNPIIVHISSREMLGEVAVELPELAWRLISKFWPGPLTLVLRRNLRLPELTVAGLDTVAVRMPRHRVALRLIEEAERPIAAPSANLSGSPSPTRAEHVIKDLYGRVDIIIDGGETEIGLESTVLSLVSTPPMILRPGGVTLEQLKEEIGEVKIHPVVLAEKELDNILAQSPGMKYRHYAPKAELLVVQGERQNVKKKIRELLEKYMQKGVRTGVLYIGKSGYGASEEISLGETGDLVEVARNLFASLRELDERGVEVIIAEGVEERGLGLAIMNRLKKAASGRIIRV